MIRHLVGALQTERLVRGGTGHAQFLDERLILPPLLEIVIYHHLPPSHVKLEIIRIGKVRTFYRQLRQHLPQPPRYI